MGVRKVAGLLIFGGWKLPSSFVANYVVSFVEPNKVLIVIIILIVIDAKGAQALRAAGQPVVAGLVLRSGAPRAPATAGGAQSLAPVAAAKGLAALPHDSATGSLSPDNSGFPGRLPPTHALSSSTTLATKHPSATSD